MPDPIGHASDRPIKIMGTIVCNSQREYWRDACLESCPPYGPPALQGDGLFSLPAVQSGGGLGEVPRGG